MSTFGILVCVMCQVKCTTALLLLALLPAALFTSMTDVVVVEEPAYDAQTHQIGASLLFMALTTVVLILAAYLGR